LIKITYIQLGQILRIDKSNIPKKGGHLLQNLQLRDQLVRYPTVICLCPNDKNLLQEMFRYFTGKGREEFEPQKFVSEEKV
jgi:hypothetical protein